MNKTITTVLAIIGALAAICAALMLIKKKFGCKCCCMDEDECSCGKPETVEDFVENATETVADKVEEARNDVEDKVEEAKEKAEAIVEEFKDYADVELPNE